jgi:hypothetical protein
MSEDVAALDNDGKVVFEQFFYEPNITKADQRKERVHTGRVQRDGMELRPGVRRDVQVEMPSVVAP